MATHGLGDISDVAVLGRLRRSQGFLTRVLPAGARPGAAVGLENHLNYIHRSGGTVALEEAYGLGAVLGSTLVDDYFRISNGNTQVNAGELRALPLPGSDQLRAIGAAVLAAGVCCLARQHETDGILARHLAT